MHLARMPAYYKALTAGQILPRWAGDLNWGYGMPLFNFYYHLPYLVPAGFIAMGTGLVASFKIIHVMSFLLSAGFMYLFSRSFFKNNPKALLATLLYQFAPFHMVNLMVRGDTGEVLAMAFLPLMLYFIYRGFEQNKPFASLVATGISTALLLLSHTAVGLMCMGIALLFILIFAPSNRKRAEAFVGLGVGLLIDTFYWLPILLERKYTYGDTFMKDMYTSHFVPFIHFFIPNITNSTSLQRGGVDISFGLMQTLGLGAALWLLIKGEIHDVFSRRVIIFTLILVIASLYIMHASSRVFWEQIPSLRAFQFPWRFLNVSMFALSLMGATSLLHKSTPKNAIYLFTIITVLSTLVYFRPPLGFDRVNEADFWNYPLNTTYFGETDLIWSAGMPGKYPKAPFEIIEGNGSIQNPIKKQIHHTFTVKAETAVRIVDHTQYYPGWRVYADQEKIPIEFQDQNWRGVITFKLPPGSHTVIVHFGESPIRAIAEIISVSTIIILGLSFLI